MHIPQSLDILTLKKSSRLHQPMLVHHGTDLYIWLSSDVFFYHFRVSTKSRQGKSRYTAMFGRIELHSFICLLPTKMKGVLDFVKLFVTSLYLAGFLNCEAGISNPKHRLNSSLMRWIACYSCQRPNGQLPICVCKSVHV